jgi:hypothetical protein
MLVPARLGQTPELSTAGPQRQLTEIAPASVWGRLVKESIAFAREQN